MLIKLDQIERGDVLKSLDNDVANAVLATNEEMQTLIPNTKVLALYDKMTLQKAINNHCVNGIPSPEYINYLQENGRVPWDALDFSYITDASYSMSSQMVLNLKQAPMAINTEYVESMRGLFQNQNFLIEVQPFKNLARCQDVSEMFKGCYSLKTVPDFELIYSRPKCDWMFHHCEAMEVAPKINSYIDSAASMFYACKKLKTIPEYSLSCCSNMSNIFYGTALTGEFPWTIDMNSIQDVDSITGMFGQTGVTKVTLRNVPQILNPDNKDNKLSSSTLSQWLTNGKDIEVVIENYRED